MTRRAALVAAVVALAGCGGETETPDPETIVQAARTTDGRGGVHVVFRAALTVEGVPQTVEFRGEGDEDRRARTSNYELDLSDFAELDDSVGSPKDFRATMVKRGPVAWMRLGLLDRLLPTLGFAEGKWLQVDLRQRAESRTAAGRLFAQLNEQQPGLLLDYVHAAEATERVGEETLAGVPTIRYRGRVVLDDLATKLPPDERVAVQNNANRVRETTGDDEVPIDVWIGRDALIRRIRLRYDIERSPRTNQEVDGQLEATVDLSGFGRRVVPRVPPEGQVVSVAELIEGLE